MKRFTYLTREDGRTIIDSMHQPSTKVFKLFHNLYLLARGRMVYFSKVSKASEVGNRYFYFLCNIHIIEKNEIQFG